MILRTSVFLSLAAVLGAGAGRLASAQVPPAIHEELVRLGQNVFPACTAKLYRPLMPENDYNTYWPPDQDQPNTDVVLYPGITLARDVRFGPDPKDLIDIFVGESGAPDNRTVLIYVPGGGGNKIEQQAPQSNAFYDNIGRWAAGNGMVGVTMQRHGGNPQGQDIATMIAWLQDNIAGYSGNPDRMFIWAHSAGNGPLGGYIGRPDLYGIGVVGAVFMSGNPVTFGAGGGRGGFGGGFGGGTTPAPSPCSEVGGMGGALGAIRGPSSQLPDAGRDAAAVRNAGIQWNGRQWVGTLPEVGDGGGRGGFGGGRGAAGRGAGGAGARGGAVGRGGRGATGEGDGGLTVQEGFRTTTVSMMLAWSELDPGVVDAEMPAGAVSIHEELCGVGRCPTMFMAKDHSHMSEVFSIGTDDETVSGAILDWIQSIE